MKSIIQTSNLTKDYGHGKGIFSVNLSVSEGEVFGFLGPNGAGKTTTIRNLMGFIRPDQGSCTITGLDCFHDGAKIQQNLGYLAGEIAFLDDLSGRQLLDFIASVKGIHNNQKMLDLIERFELDPKGRVKKMSKGMKQKIGLICAFMGDPQILILDEPTSGLDPLMQNRFIELILEEKKKGKTIFMSSHIFEEIERTCDRTAIIKEGKIASIEDVHSLKAKKSKTFLLTFESAKAALAFEQSGTKILERHDNQVSISVKGNLPTFLETVSRLPITDLDVKSQSLEEIFLHYYGGDNS